MWTKLQVTVGKLISNSYHFALLNDKDTSTGKVTSLMGAANRFSKIVQNILGPILTFIGVAAVIYAVYLGVMYAKAESAEKRKEVQGRLIGACIGAVIIVAGATLCFALEWAKIYHSFAITDHTWSDTNADGWCDTCATAK